MRVRGREDLLSSGLRPMGVSPAGGRAFLTAGCCLSIGTDEFTVSASSSQICARQLNMLLTGVWGEVGLRQLTEPRPVASLAVAAFQIY